jgi:hypothetical protein
LGYPVQKDRSFALKSVHTSLHRVIIHTLISELVEAAAVDTVATRKQARDGSCSELIVVEAIVEAVRT